jgi:hypothetical protein
VAADKTGTDNYILENEDMTRIYNVCIYPARDSDVLALREDVRSWLEARGDCEVLGGGISLQQPIAAELNVRFGSAQAARSAFEALRDTHSARGVVDVS